MDQDGFEVYADGYLIYGDIKQFKGSISYLRVKLGKTSAGLDFKTGHQAMTDKLYYPVNAYYFVGKDVKLINLELIMIDNKGIERVAGEFDIQLKYSNKSFFQTVKMKNASKYYNKFQASFFVRAYPNIADDMFTKTEMNGDVLLFDLDQIHVFRFNNTHNHIMSDEKAQVLTFASVTDHSCLLTKPDFTILKKSTKINELYNCLYDNSLENLLKTCRKDENAKKLSSTEKTKLIYSLCNAISYLNCQGINHQNIIPSSIYLNSKKETKLCSFNIVRDTKELSDQYKIYAQKKFYYPQTPTNGFYSFADDIYAIGSIAYELLTGFVRLKDITCYTFDNIAEPMKTILKAMLDKDPDNRPTSHELKYLIESGYFIFPGTDINELNRYVSEVSCKHEFKFHSPLIAVDIKSLKKLFAENIYDPVILFKTGISLYLNELVSESMDCFKIGYEIVEPYCSYCYSVMVSGAEGCAYDPILASFVNINHIHEYLDQDTYMYKIIQKVFIDPYKKITNSLDYSIEVSSSNGIPFPKNFRCVFNLARNLAIKGDAHAQCVLGQIYSQGFPGYVEPNLQKGIYFLELSAKQNFAYAYLVLGELYHDGKHATKDIAKAIKYYEQGSKLGDRTCPNKLGIIYEFGSSVPVNKDMAYKYYKLAAERGDCAAQLNIGYLYEDPEYKYKDFKKAFEYYQLSAFQDHFDGYYNLGNMLNYGRGIQANYKQAMYYFLHAARKNVADAFFHLAVYYQIGRPVEKDIRKSLYFYELGANNGQMQCCQSAGILYYQDNVIERDYAMALFYFELGSYKGSTVCMMNAAQILFGGFGGIQVDKNRAFKYIQMAARAGDPEGLYYLGLAHYNGEEYASKDYKKAFDCFTRASNEGNLNAMFQLGMMYEYGYYVQKDFSKAFDIMKRAAARNHIRAQCNLGYLYIEGLGVQKNIPEAIKWLEKSANNGFNEAYYNLACVYKEQNCITKYKHYIEKAADSGITRAQADLANEYLVGGNFPFDINKAEHYLKLAADNGDIGCQYNYAVIYSSGEHFPINYQKAVHYFKLAADKGHKESQLNLGYFYHEGKGVAKDYNKAAFYYKKSADQGFDVAQYNMGKIHQAGEGVPIDLGKAARYFEAAANQGYAKARYELGKAYLKGSGVAKDNEKAYHYMKMAADQEHADAQYQVGIMFRDGIGVEQEIELAREYFFKALNNGCPEAGIAFANLNQ